MQIYRARSFPSPPKNVDLDEGSVTSFRPRGPGGGGALFAPSQSPHDSEEIYVSTDMGSVFHSTSFGQRWATIPFRKLEGDTHSEVAFTHRPGHLFALNAAFGTRRLVESRDHGRTFVAITSTPPNPRATIALLSTSRKVQEWCSPTRRQSISRPMVDAPSDPFTKAQSSCSQVPDSTVRKSRLPPVRGCSKPATAGLNDPRSPIRNSRGGGDCIFRFGSDASRTALSR